MENKLAQEYKDDLYNKVLEKRNIRNKRRKQCLTFCIVFIMFIGITGLGFSKFKKEDYKNFFKSETENIMLNDEYEYFDDLGIKLEFINVDKNSITLGINIKYENIADYKLEFNKISINIDEYKYNYIKNKKIEFDSLIYDYKIINKDEINCIIDIRNVNTLDVNKIIIDLEDCLLNYNEILKVININYKKEISIGL